MEETTARNGEVVGLKSVVSNNAVTNSIKGGTLKPFSESINDNNHKVIDIGSKM